MAPKASETKEKARFTIADLRPAEGAVRPKKRVGRGWGSGHGRTAARGNNGEGQRSGNSRKIGFEGGQMPLFRRLPRIEGFKVINRKYWAIINVCDLETIAKGAKSLTLEDLISKRIYNPNRHDGVRLLGNGDSAKGISIEVHYASQSAKEKLEAAGGKLTIVSTPPKEAAKA